VLAGEPATNDIFDGIDTTWNRVPGGSEIATLAAEAIAQFNPQEVAASVPALLKLHALLAALPDKDPVVAEKSAQLDHLLQSCLGLHVETTISQAEVVPGETMRLTHAVMVGSALPVRWVAVKYPGVGGETRVATDLQANVASAVVSGQKLPANTPLSQPYWLREDHAPGTFTVDNPALIGQPENPPVFPVQYVFEVGGQTLLLPDEPVELLTNSTAGVIRRQLDVISPVALKLGSDVVLFAPGKSRPVEVTITAFRASQSGTLQLETPDGWNATPAKQSFALHAVGEQQTLRFEVTAPAQTAAARIVASAEIGGQRYRNQREEISYPHIPRQLLQPAAAFKALSLDLAIRGQKVGYLPGAGDNVAAAIQQMGYAVTRLGGDDLTTNRLRDFDAVVLGVRAFNVRTDLASHLPALFAYVAGGGTLIEQYNRPGNDAKTEQLAPYNLRISGDRVTDKTAAMTFLAPENPVLNIPNKITNADFDGWVQERGIYFPNQWDDHFTPILACNDPGESPLKGALLVAPYGQGHFVYTSLVFFRELPAGVPGAYRLFANLLSLGR
jgi:hypothetical protein